MGGSAPDDSQVSGFYGPGSWAAWMIMLVSSWILIILNDYDNNTHFIAYTLYMNWAAIQYFKNMSGVKSYELLIQDKLLTQSIDAAGAVVVVGTTHGLLQGLFCLSKQLSRSVAAEAKRKLKKRTFIIYIGLFLPLKASSYHSPTLFILMMVGSIHGIIMALIMLIDVLGFPFFKYITSPEMTYPFMANTLLLSIGQFPELASLVGIKIPSWANDITLPSISSLLLDRCHYIPCAPQKINEWDQLFALLAALVLFFYEFHTAILVLAGRLMHAIGNSYTRLFQSSSRTSASRLEQDAYEMQS